MFIFCNIIFLLLYKKRLEEDNSKKKKNKCFKVFLLYVRLMSYGACSEIIKLNWNEHQTIFKRSRFSIQNKMQSHLPLSKILRHELICCGQSQLVKGKERVRWLSKIKTISPEGREPWMKKTTSLKMAVILSRIFNIIISIWQGKNPICHWKICPQTKQWWVRSLV